MEKTLRAVTVSLAYNEHKTTAHRPTSPSSLHFITSFWACFPTYFLSFTSSICSTACPSALRAQHVGANNLYQTSSHAWSLIYIRTLLHVLPWMLLKRTSRLQVYLKQPSNALQICLLGESTVLYPSHLHFITSFCALFLINLLSFMSKLGSRLHLTIYPLVQRYYCHTPTLCWHFVFHGNW